MPRRLRLLHDVLPRPFDLVIWDWRMPEMSGLELLQRLRNAGNAVPFIMLTRKASHDAVVEARESGVDGYIAVKVHWEAHHDLDLKMFRTVATTEYGWDFKGILTDGQSEGVCGYVQGDLYGDSAGHTYGFGAWLNLMTSYTATAGHIHVPFEGGVWCGEVNAAARIVFAGQHQAILTGAPASLNAWRLNTTQTVDALIAAANAGSVGYVADAGVASTKVGAVPLVDVVGHGIRWVRLYDASN